MSLLLTLLGMLIPSAHAALDDWGSDNPGVQAMWEGIRGVLYTRDDPVASLVGATILFIYPLIGGVALLIILYAGVRIITSQGKEDVISNAKNMILYALIGVVLGMMSSTVIAYFADTFFPNLLQ